MLRKQTIMGRPEGFNAELILSGLGISCGLGGRRLKTWGMKIRFGQ